MRARERSSGGRLAGRLRDAAAGGGVRAACFPLILHSATRLGPIRERVGNTGRLLTQVRVCVAHMAPSDDHGRPHGCEARMVGCSHAFDLGTPISIVCSSTAASPVHSACAFRSLRAVVLCCSGRVSHVRRCIIQALAHYTGRSSVRFCPRRFSTRGLTLTCLPSQQTPRTYTGGEVRRSSGCLPVLRLYCAAPPIHWLSQEASSGGGAGGWHFALRASLRAQAKLSAASDSV